MNEIQTIKYRGFNFGHLVLAGLTGAAAGAAIVYISALVNSEDGARQFRKFVDRSQDSLAQAPTALRGAIDAAREAFNESLASSASQKG